MRRLGPDALKSATALINAINPGLSSFFARGGKLILYHGWTDPLIAPGDSIDYFNSVRGKLRQHAVDESPEGM